MTERFPEQRNRSAQRRADAPQVPASAANGAAPFGDDDAPLVFDESFIAAAPVREPSAQARALLAKQRAESAADPSEFSFFEPLRRRWTVRPSHHLRALRLPAVAAAVSALAGVALLLALLR